MLVDNILPKKITYFLGLFIFSIISSTNVCGNHLASLFQTDAGVINYYLGQLGIALKLDG